MSYLKNQLSRQLIQNVLETLWSLSAIQFDERSKAEWQNGITTSLQINTRAFPSSLEHRKLLTQIFHTIIMDSGCDFQKICCSSRHGMITSTTIASELQVPLITYRHGIANRYTHWTMPDIITIDKDKENTVIATMDDYLIPYAVELANRNHCWFASLSNSKKRPGQKMIHSQVPRFKTKIILLTNKNPLEEIGVAKNAFTQLGITDITLCDISRHLSHATFNRVDTKKDAIIISGMFTTGERTLEEIVQLREIGLDIKHHFCTLSYLFDIPGSYLPNLKTTTIVSPTDIFEFLDTTNKFSSEKRKKMKEEYKSVCDQMTSLPYTLKEPT